MRPIALYDKSFIQSLNPKEAELFGCFFATNIPPVLIQEIGADLKKEETTEPTKYVSNIAIKLFEPNSHLNVDHRILCVSELAGNTVTLEYKPLSNYDYTNFVDHHGKIGTIIQRPEVVEKLERWSKGEFSKEDYNEAQEWRNLIDTIPKESQSDLKLPNNIKTPEEAKEYTLWLMHNFYKNKNRGSMLRYTLDRFGVTTEHREIIMRRWKASGGLALVDFAPYTAYVILIELFFDIALAAKVFENIKGWNRPTNRIDLVYLYYLPFTEIFISGDAIQRKIAELFIDNNNQEVIDSNSIKPDLTALVNYYLNDPELETKGLFRLAEYPPLEGNFEICRIYDKFCKGWRNHAANPVPITPELQEHINKLVENAENSMSGLFQSSLEDQSTLIFKRHIQSPERGWGNLMKPERPLV